MTLRRQAQTLLVVLALGAPFMLVAHAAQKLMAPLTTGSVRLLLRATALLAPPAPEAQLDDAELAPEDDSLTDEAMPVTPAGLEAPARRFQKPVVKAPSALFVSQATVLKLAQSAARPHGAFVAQTAEHPAGLRLSDVASLGIGVQDGDILIEALGITPRSPGQVIGAIIEARAQKARVLTGTLWRHGQTFRITVEQPYGLIKGNDIDVTPCTHP